VPSYELRVSANASRALARLPEAAATAIVEFMSGSLLDNPHRVGKRLRLELEGYLGGRRGAYRIVYRVEDERFVRVVRIDHRADIYRRR
jgi:mRNA-degrading endonuclease RelE of RelBE toxin-antitoxin system